MRVAQMAESNYERFPCHLKPVSPPITRGIFATVIVQATRPSITLSAAAVTWTLVKLYRHNRPRCPTRRPHQPQLATDIARGAIVNVYGQTGNTTHYNEKAVRYDKCLHALSSKVAFGRKTVQWSKPPRYAYPRSCRPATIIIEPFSVGRYNFGVTPVIEAD